MDQTALRVILAGLAWPQCVGLCMTPSKVQGAQGVAQLNLSKSMSMAVDIADGILKCMFEKDALLAKQRANEMAPKVLPS